MHDWRIFVREHFKNHDRLSREALEELAQHVEETWRSAKSAGCSEAEALAAARAELLDRPASLPRQMIDRERSAGPAAWIAAFARDLRHALRLLRGRPGFTAVAVLTLALGIGANTAIFSVVRSLILEPLPFPEPDRLVMLWEAEAQDTARTMIVAAPNYLDWRRDVRSFEETAIWEQLSFNLSGDTEAERVSGMRVSASAFAMLGVAPQLGRAFTPEEDEPGHDLVVISDALWRRRFGARPDIIGQAMRVNGRPFEIVGVMPPTFRFIQRETAVWVPIAFNAEDAHRGSHSFYAAARLRPGITVTAARAELESLGRALAREHPDSNNGETATLTPMTELGVRELKPTLLALGGAVAFVLLIACVNVANLLLAQASARRQEFAVRSALGASRWRIARQLVAEGLAIAMLGGAAGLAVAWGARSVLEGVLPPSIVFAPFRDAASGIRLDPWVLGFTFAIAVLTGLLFSLAPMIGLKRGAADLRAGGDRRATGRLTAMRATLVAAEVALALIVLVAAGLMVKSLLRLVDVDPGLDPRQVLVVTMTLPQADFYGRPERQHYCEQVTERVGSLPGILSVGAISHVPLSGANAGRGFSIEGRQFPPGENASAAYRLTCPGYFRTLGIPMIKGRDFDARDATDAPGVVILNEEAATRYWPNQDPIGKRIKLGELDSPNPWMTVVGVVRSVRHFGLDEAARREMFRPYSQAAWPVMSVMVKTAADPAGFATSIRSALRRIDPDLPVSRVDTMTAIERDSTGSRRFPMLLLGAFGAVALVLAIIGVYGVVSYLVAQRSREIGIRVALGAQRAQVLRLVVGGALRPVIAGLAAGSIGAVFTSRLLGTLLFDVKPSDPSVLAMIAGTLAGAALLASLVPARRATRVDPVQVLRAD
jgi:putative ABC transport system permease protein